MCFDRINKQKCVLTELHTKYVLNIIKITEMYIDLINNQKCVLTVLTNRKLYFDRINKQKCVSTELHTKYVLTLIKTTEMHIDLINKKMCFDYINKQKYVLIVSTNRNVFRLNYTQNMY